MTLGAWATHTSGLSVQGYFYHSTIFYVDFTYYIPSENDASLNWSQNGSKCGSYVVLYIIYILKRSDHAYEGQATLITFLLGCSPAREKCICEFCQIQLVILVHKGHVFHLHSSLSSDYHNVEYL